MIRVIYRWRVAAENFEQFRDAWRATTNHIHDSVPAARGSFMLRSADDPTAVLTIARWDSFADWKGFFGNSDPTQMQRMRELGERLSVDAYEEIEDHTR